MNTEPLNREDRLKFEADQAQIESALAIAKSQRELRANAAPPAAPVLPEAMMINGMPHIPAPSPEEFLRQAFAEVHAAWESPRDARHLPSGHSKAVEALEALNTALAQLEDRAGDRAQETREWLTAQRDRILAAKAAYESPRHDLIARIERGRAAVAAAYQVLHFAKPAEVREARLRIDEAEAAGRELDRDIAAVAQSMRFVQPLNLTEFYEAKCATIDLERKPGKRSRVRDIQAAIEEGQRASSNRARLWIVYETKTEAEHELLKWRWRGYAERNQ